MCCYLMLIIWVVQTHSGHFFSDLEAARNSVLYASVGAVGRVFMEIEREAFRMASPGLS